MLLSMCIRAGNAIPRFFVDNNADDGHVCDRMVNASVTMYIGKTYIAGLIFTAPICRANGTSNPGYKLN